MILAGTNNYLGLTLDTQCIEAAVRAVREEGTGTTGSRMANGSYSGHVALEKDLADFYGRRWCVVFSTGYVANLGLISALTGPGDVILIDADCHASIYDGCRMSGAEVIRFRHNDVGDLDKRLRRFGGRRANALIVVEGIYSTLGDRAALAEVAAVKQEHGACLLVDEAHSLGVLGERGRGLSEESDVERSVDFIVGTFSKSLGATGGFCVSDHHEAELIRYGSRPYIFTASPSPAVVASTRAALNRLESSLNCVSCCGDNAGDCISHCRRWDSDWVPRLVRLSRSGSAARRTIGFGTPSWIKGICQHDFAAGDPTAAACFSVTRLRRTRRTRSIESAKRLLPLGISGDYPAATALMTYRTSGLRICDVLFGRHAVGY
jgi:hypothetical protein